MAEAVGEPAGRHEQGGDDDEVAVEHPGERVPARAREGGRDVGEGDVDDRRVEEGEEGARTGDRHRRFYDHGHTSRRATIDYVRGHSRHRRRRAGRSPSAATAARCCSTAPGSCSPRRATRAWSCATSPSAARPRAARSTTTSPAASASSPARRPSSRARRSATLIERSLEERGLRETLALFGELFRRRVADHPERIGCPVAAAALARPEDPALAAAATAAFQSWERPIAAALRDEGVGGRDAEAFAGLVVSTVEGALIRARAAGSQEPLDSAIAGLGQALDALLGSA